MQVEINSYEDIGDYLREVRESLELDPRDIGQRLNIRAKYLTALEEGRIDAMPGKIYARGYLQNYAEFLGLDKEEIAEAFDRLNGEGARVRYFVPEPTERNYQPGMVVVGLAIIAVLTVYYYWYENHNTSAVPDSVRVSPVPERLIDPIVETPEVQENDDTYIAPESPRSSDLQGDNNIAPDGDALPESAVPVEQSPAPAAAAPVPAPEQEAQSPAPQPEREVVPAVMPELQQPSETALPWLGE